MECVIGVATQLFNAAYLVLETYSTECYYYYRDWNNKTCNPIGPTLSYYSRHINRYLSFVNRLHYIAIYDDIIIMVTKPRLFLYYLRLY